MSKCRVFASLRATMRAVDDFEGPSKLRIGATKAHQNCVLNKLAADAFSGVHHVPNRGPSNQRRTTTKCQQTHGGLDKARKRLVRNCGTAEACRDQETRNTNNPNNVAKTVI